MEIKVFNSELTYLGVVDDFESFTFVSKYNACGSFKIKGMYTPQAKQYLVLGNIVYFNGFAGFIHSIEIEMADGEESIVVNGYDMCGYLARRIVWDTVNYNGNLETFLRKLVDENCISTSETRTIPFLSLGDVSGLTETIEKQVSYMNLLEVLEETALAYDVGFSVDFSPKDKKLIFNVYKGSDRTAGTANPLIFNRDYENILSETYINSTKQLKNVALVGGMGEGTARTFVSLGDAVGLGRYEMFVDAKDLQQSDLTDTEYKAQLFQRGTEKLADCYIVESFEGEANTNADFSFSLGDKVSIIDKSLNIRLDTRITAIERIIERKGTTTNLTFGNCVPTIYKKMGVY